jgi:hypothetical protein
MTTLKRAALAAAAATALLAPIAFATEPQNSTSGVDSIRVVRDKATGRLRAPSQDELREMLAAEKAERKAKGLSESSAEPAPLQVREHANGMKSAVLGADYLVTLEARRDADGKLTKEHDSAAHEHSAVADERPLE